MDNNRSKYLRVDDINLNLLNSEHYKIREAAKLTGVKRLVDKDTCISD